MNLDAVKKRSFESDSSLKPETMKGLDIEMESNRDSGKALNKDKRKNFGLKKL